MSQTIREQLEELVNQVDAAAEIDDHEDAPHFRPIDRSIADVVLMNRELFLSAQESALQLAAAKEERDKFKDTLDRIATAYPQVAGPDDCPPSTHACDKCEIYFLLRNALGPAALSPAQEEPRDVL